MERDKSESRRPDAFAGLPSPSVIAPKDWPQVVDKNVGEAIQAFRETQDRSYKIERSHTHTLTRVFCWSSRLLFLAHCPTCST